MGDGGPCDDCDHEDENEKNYLKIIGIAPQNLGILLLLFLLFCEIILRLKIFYCLLFT
jgi:hypothetical protein